MKKINVATFNWGPCVVKFKMEDDFKKLLLYAIGGSFGMMFLIILDLK